MTKTLLPSKLKICFALLAVFTAVFSVQAQSGQEWSINTSPLSAPTGFVNDYAGVVDPTTKQQLEAKLKNLKDTTNPQVEIAVAVVKTTGDRPIDDYSLAVARGWKIGSKSDDNPSALLFIAIDDRKYFTQVSKDLEDELPDSLAGTLQRQYLVPEFRKGNYAKGISDTIDAYIATIKKTNTAAPQKPASRGGTESVGGSVFGLFCCAIIVLIILIAIFSRSKGGPTGRDNDRWGGGGFGSGGGGSVLPWIVGGIIGNALGSGGSSSSSGWGGSSSSDSGGFGGFGGGGDFGGGGAGGDW